MAVHPLGFHWRENSMNPMSFHFVKSTLQPDEPKLNDLTHGGIIQVKGRCTNSGIKQNFPKQDIANLLTGSATMSLLASQELVEITNNYPIVEQLHQSFGELFAEYVTGSAGSDVAS